MSYEALTGGAAEVAYAGGEIRRRPTRSAATMVEMTIEEGR